MRLIAFVILASGQTFSQEIQLTFDDYDHGHPRWSPDGNWIAYNRGGWTYKVGSNGGTQFRLSPNTLPFQYPDWSPDSQKLTCSVEDPLIPSMYQIGTLNASGGGEAILTTGDYYRSEPKWCPDGEWIGYWKYDETGYSQIYKIAAAGAPETPLTSSPCNKGRLDWSPDSAWIAFSRTDDSGHGQICKVPSAGGTMVDLTFDEHGHGWLDWSPDGNWIAYEKRDVTGSIQIYKVPSFGGPEVAITTDSVSHTWPRWSPDSRWIAYYRTDATGRAQIFKVGAGGGPEIPLTNEPEWHQFPDWSPDGEWIAYERYDEATTDYQIFKVSSAGPSATMTPTGVTATPTATVTPTASATPTLRPTGTSTMTVTASGTAWPTFTPTLVPTLWPSFTPTLVATSSPTVTSTPVSSSPASGWLDLRSEAPVAGFELYGEEVSGRLAGVPMVPSAQTTSYFSHFASDRRWSTTFALVSPGGAGEASATLSFRDDGGRVVSQRSLTVPAWGKVSGSLSGYGLSGKGWFEISSDRPLVCIQGFQDVTAGGGIAALLSQSPSEAGVAIPHFHESEAWSTGLSLLNLSGFHVLVDLCVYDRQGQLLASAAHIISDKGTITGYVADLVPGLVRPCTGWLSAIPRSGSIAGLAVYHNPGLHRLAAMPGQDAGGSNRAYFPYVRLGSGWWTAVALANPGDQEVGLNVAAYTGAGIKVAPKAVPTRLGPKEQVTGYATDWFDLGRVTKGWIEVSSTGGSFIGAVFMDRTTSDGSSGDLVAGSPCEPSVSLVGPHYVSTSRWWTLFAVANPGATCPTAVNVTAWGADGTEGKTFSCVIAPKGHIAELVSDALNPQ